MKKSCYPTLLLLLLMQSLLQAQPLTPMVDSILMRDGRKLAASIHIPAGCVGACPVILIQTPYHRQLYNFTGLPLGIGMNLNNSNYIFVIVDWRGFYGSAAAMHVGAPTRGQDGYDAVEWVYAQPWCNGKIGTCGPSALGRVQFMTAKENPPHLTCINPSVAGPQYNYLEYFPGGVYRTEYVEQLDGLGFGMSPILLANPIYNLLWTGAEQANYYPDSIRVPTFMIGGWYDHTIVNMLDFFNGIKTNSPANVQHQHRLLMGPWVHGGNGIAKVGTAIQGQLTYNNAAGWNDSLSLAFFDYHLRNINNNWQNTPTVRYYQMGSNTWESSTQWPPWGITNTNYYLHSDNSIDNVAPANANGSLSFNYDPTNPSPTIGGSTLRSDLDQGPYDQAPIVENRNDILIFSTTTLAQDLMIKGKIEIHLSVSSDKKDTDFDVRLTDVYPNNTSMLVMDGTYRMRFRNGFAAADTMVMTPNQKYNCVIELPSTCITFLAGHKLRLDITSSNYPRFNRNDNSGGAMYPGNNGDSLLNPQTASNTVYTNSNNTSFLVLPIAVPSSINELSTAIEMNIFPSPADDFLTIDFGKVFTGEISFYNANGALVETEQMKGKQLTKNFSSLPAGIYFIRAVGSDVALTKKIVICR